MARTERESAEKLEHTGPAEKERVASVPRRKQLAVCPEYQIMRGETVNVSETTPWLEMRNQSESMERKAWTL